MCLFPRCSDTESRQGNIGYLLMTNPVAKMNRCVLPSRIPVSTIQLILSMLVGQEVWSDLGLLARQQATC